MPPLDALIPGSIGVLLCGGAGAWATLQLGRALAAKGWPQSDGIVTAVHVEERRSRNGPSGRLHLSYRWDEGGRTRTGGRVFFGDGLEGNLAVCRALAERYPAGAHVTVYHSGAQSCLEPRASLRLWLLAPGAWTLAALIARAALIGEG
ncbi:MAG: DUF3592 domain-containing protein [Myxococcota bacterium]